MSPDGNGGPGQPDIGGSTAAQVLGLSPIPTSAGCVTAFMQDAHPAYVSAGALIGILAQLEEKNAQNEASLQLAKMLQESTAAAAGLLVRVNTLEEMLMRTTRFLSEGRERADIAELYADVIDAVDEARDAAGLPSLEEPE